MLWIGKANAAIDVLTTALLTPVSPLSHTVTLSHIWIDFSCHADTSFMAIIGYGGHESLALPNH